MKKNSKPFVPIKEALDQAFFEADKLNEEGKAQLDINSGYAFLDKLFINKARPHFSIISVPEVTVGSSYLAGSILSELGIRFKRTIHISTMQLSAPRFAMIMLHSVSNLNPYLLRTGRLPSEQWSDLSRAAREIADSNIYVDGKRIHSIKSIRKNVQQAMKDAQIDLFVIDNLQFITRQRKQGRQAREYQQICHALRELSEDLGISILLMSEFRSKTRRKKKIPN